MKEFKTGKFKVKLRSAPVKLKAVLIVLIVLSTAALVALRWVHNGIQAETQRKTEQAAAMEGENADLIRELAERLAAGCEQLLK